METALAKPVGFERQEYEFISALSAKRTNAAYSADLSQFVSYWRDRGVEFESVEQLQLGHFVDFRDHLQDELGLAPATVVRRMAVLKSLMRFALNMGYITHNPLAVLKLPRPGSRENQRRLRREGGPAHSRAVPTGPTLCQAP
jgi:site-specific recombinase XerD